MAPKVYLRNGKKGYKELRMINQLEAEFEKRLKADPNFKFEPAKDKEDLKRLYDKYVVTDTEFEDVPPSSQEKTSANTTSTEEAHKEFKKGMEETVEKPEVEEFSNEPFIDPLNREEPIVRDYVTKEEFPDQPNSNQGEPIKTSFDEPRSHAESFDMPDEDGSSNTAGSGSNLGGTKAAGPDKDKKKPEPVNPQFDEMSKGKQKRSTKKFAKAIVYGVCKLSEYGCVWFATKDITESKLVEYEVNGEISRADYGLLLTLDDNQSVTIREWFSMQVRMAPDILKVSQEEQDDLADALAAVMEEKGIAPTPMQELIIQSVTTLIIGLGVKAYAFQVQINGVLNQIRVSKQAQQPSYSTPSQEGTPAPEPERQTEPTPTSTEKEFFNGSPQPSDNLSPDQDDQQPQLQIGEIAQTVE